MNEQESKAPSAEPLVPVGQVAAIHPDGTMLLMPHQSVSA
jgi:hypothetical protein